MGEFMALLGPNGAGKSTFLGIVVGLVKKTSGQIQVCGYDIDSQVNQAKSCIGLVPQEFNFNIFEECLNIVLFSAGYFGIPSSVALPRAEKLFKDLELWDKRKEPARNLSGGMKRRLMLARALVTQPKILILDEPSAGLDIELRHHLWSYLRELNQAGTTILLTTHYLEEAEMLCRRVAIIDKGLILRDCSIQELLSEGNQKFFCVQGRRRDSGSDFSVLPDYMQISEDPDQSSEPGQTAWKLLTTQSVPLNEVFQQLDRAGIDVSDFRSHKPKLEELFLKLVGKGRAS